MSLSFSSARDDKSHLRRDSVSASQGEDKSAELLTNQPESESPGLPAASGSLLGLKKRKKADAYV